jgi:polyisoprenoid-binding protein YceI
MPWEFDQNHRNIGFSARHLGISTIHGFFEKADVTLNLESDDPTQWSMRAVVDPSSINTGISRRDDALRGESYLEVDKYPEIRFETQRIERQGDGYRIVGALTMHGVTNEVALQAAFNGEAVDREILKRGFSAQGTIDRFAFGVGDPDHREKTWTVSDEIKLVLDMEAVKK